MYLLASEDMGVVVKPNKWKERIVVVGLADHAGLVEAGGVNIAPEWLVDDWDGVELGPEVVE